MQIYDVIKIILLFDRVTRALCQHFTNKFYLIAQHHLIAKICRVSFSVSDIKHFCAYHGTVDSALTACSSTPLSTFGYGLIRPSPICI